MTTKTNNEKKTATMTVKKSKSPQPVAAILKKVGGVIEILGRLEQDYKDKKAEFAKFFERMPKVVNCKLHDSGCTCNLLEDESFAHFFRTGEIRPQYGVCSTEILERLVNERHGKWLKMGIPRKVVDATFENYETVSEVQVKARDRVKAFMARGRGFLMLIGKNGTGKSHMAAACLKQHGFGKFIIQADLIDNLRNSYKEGNKRSMILEYQTAGFLVIDEIDADLKGDDITPFLYQVLSYRYDNDLITILTTNEDMDTLLQILGSRVEDRIASNYVVAKFTWDSHRRSHRVAPNDNSKSRSVSR